MTDYPTSPESLRHVISQTRKFVIFTHIQKTAGTTFTSALLKEVSGKRIRVHTLSDRERFIKMTSADDFRDDDTVLLYGHAATAL